MSRGDQIFYETHFGPALAMQGKIREIAVDVVTAGGSRLPVLVNSVLIRDADSGAPRVIRTAVFDARERRSYERELLAARERAEASEARARALASTLQSTFLPPAILTIPGLDVAGAYRPAGDGTEVGGDFYDVFQTGEDTWGIVLGDVSGKGAGAAALTAVARYTVRAEAVRSLSAADVLRAVDRALREQDGTRFCTAVFLSIEQSSGDGVVRITVASGGHHLPLHVGSDGAVRSIGEIGWLLGMLDHIEVKDSTHALGAGEALVLFTDGVTEARDPSDEFFGEARLAALVESLAAEDARSIADRIVAEALAFQSGLPRDDIAVVVVKR